MVGEFSSVVAELGGAAAMGRPLSNEGDLRSAIRDGFPAAVVTRMLESAGLTLKELSNGLDLSPRSLQRRGHTGKLARHESDRVYRLARVVALAKQSIGEDAAALRWLKKPNRALGGVAPLDLLDTELGAREVENVLGRIAYGGIS